jgi:hypothetical protein
MKTIVRRPSIVFGVCAIIVNLFSTGCASISSNQTPAVAVGSTFQVDCSNRDQQIQMLRELAPSENDRLNARLQNFLMPWTAFTDPKGRAERQEIGSGRTNWQISQSMQQVKIVCQ